ncbi:MAG: Rieske (2Fe-2S) protein, partial [Gemmatimonadaceae bacterium]
CANSERRQFIQTAVAGVAALLGISMVDPSTVVAQISAISPASAGKLDRAKYPIPATDTVNIDTNNEVIIARSNGNVYAFALSCPHQNTALRWLQKDGRFQCPKHKSKYAASGEFIDGRATRNMDRLPIALEGNLVSVDIVHEIRSDQAPAQWAAAFVKVPG